MKKLHFDYLLTLLFGGLTLILLIFFIIPLLDQFKSEADKSSKEHQLLLKKNNGTWRSESIDLELQEAEAMISRRQSMLIPTDQAVNYLTQLDELAGKSGVSIKINPDFNGQPLTASIKRAPITIAIGGDLNQTLSFIDSLEKRGEVFSLEELSINAISGSTTMSSLLKGQIYLLENNNKNN